MNNALKPKCCLKVIVATDDERIFNTVQLFGNVMMTDVTHANGTSRCAEVLERVKDEEFEYVINIQGDEPMIHPEQIDQLAVLFKDKSAQIVTQAIKEINPEMLKNSNIVKVLIDENGFAIDFYRELQSEFQNVPFYKHIGIYGFKSDVLKEIVQLQPTINEKERKLEQMRWLDHGYKLKVGITEYESVSVEYSLRC